MKFGIITHAVHKIKDGQIYGYEPYVREMNLWGKHVDEIIILAPITEEEITSIEIAYHHINVKVMPIPNFDITSVKNLLRSLLVIPKICCEIYKVMKRGRPHSFKMSWEYWFIRMFGSNFISLKT
ncbi:hypothetical protein OEG92_12105 [Polaribacter sejongensis]|uniref:hypothetical protein n=1 Tax=Polaribacter sejongensis TaxID=985043 RepID=UPI0035A63688